MRTTKYFLTNTLLISVLVTTSLHAQTSRCTPATKFSDLSECLNFQGFHTLREENKSGKKIGKFIRFATPDSDSANAYFIQSKEKNAPWIFVFHEWWGLNSHIQQQAETLFRKSEKANILCLDLYDGKVAHTRDSAALFMQQVNDDRAVQIIQGARDFAGYTARILSIGWCFGGYWSMKCATLLPYQTVACVIFYGMPITDPDELKVLRADVLAIFAEHDNWINSDIRETLSKQCYTRKKISRSPSLMLTTLLPIQAEKISDGVNPEWLIPSPENF